MHEGLSIHVPCSFTYPKSLWYPSSKIHASWYRSEDRTYHNYPVATKPYKQVKKETQGQFLPADPKTGNCSLSIRDARKSHSGTYVFWLDRGRDRQYTYQDKKLTLQVTGTAGSQERTLRSGTPS